MPRRRETWESRIIGSAGSWETNGGRRQVRQLVDGRQTHDAAWGIGRWRRADGPGKGLGWRMGLEPTTAGITIRDSTN